MRGKVPIACSSSAGTGITPAYAGKSRGRSSGNNFYWDHPRLCGEKYFALLYFTSLKGSPPPMRGKAAHRTPVTICLPDHPRLCGEKPDWDGLDKTAQGSPPPMRGKVSFPALAVKERRITPAYAGKSKSPDLSSL